MKIKKHYFENHYSVSFQRKTLCPKKFIQLSNLEPQTVRQRQGAVTGYVSSDPPKYDY